MIASLAAALLTTTGFAPPAPRPLAFRAAKGRYRAEVRQSSQSGDRSFRKASAWGEFESIKNLFVDSVSLYAQGKPIDVPLSAFADVANVNEIRMEAVKGGCVLVIVGGDADVGYVAKVRVRGTNVVERTVRDGEFPENFYETTRYVSRPPNN